MVVHGKTERLKIASRPWVWWALIIFINLTSTSAHALDGIIATGAVVSETYDRYEAWPTIVSDSSGNLYAFYRTEDYDLHHYSASGRIEYAHVYG